VWNAIGPMLERIRTREVASEEQHVELQDTRLTWSSSPVLDDDGRVAGVLTVITEAVRRTSQTLESSRAVPDARLAIAHLELLDRQYRERLGSLFRTTPVPIAVTHGPEHVVEMANEAFRKLVGRRPLLGHRIREAFPEFEGRICDDLDRCFATGEKIVGNEVPIRFDRRNDGSLDEVFVTFIIQPLPVLSGRSDSTVAVVWDATDEVLARRAVHDYAERLRLALEASQLGDWELDLETGKINRSPRHDQIFGYPEMLPEWSVERFFEHVVPEDRAAVEAAFHEALAKRGTYAFESRIVRADGSPAWIEVHGRVMERGGRRRGCVLGTIADITDRKRAEDVLKHAHELAHRERENLFAVFSEAPAVIAVLRGEDLIIELANRAAFAAAGSDERVLGLPVRESMPESHGQVFMDYLRDVIRTGTPRRESELLIKMDPTHTGTLQDFYFDIAYEPLRDPDGSVNRVLVFCVDVTARVAARRTTETALQQAEAANRAKDEFLAMLGHELRNPLAPISTALHMMMEMPGGDAEKARAVIERQVDHLVRLVDDLLDVSRVTRGKVTLERVRIELAEVVAKAIEMASPLLEQREHEVTVTVPSIGLAVDADPMRLAQVISNLLTNAAKYTEPHGSIAVIGAREDDEIVVRVRDTGIGITPDMLPRVFDLFTQERQALDRARGGLGLGLAIVRSLVVLHGGSVSAYSEGAGRGSEFVVRLPAPEPGATITPVPAAPTQAEPVSATGKRVLIVDDNADAAEMLSEALEVVGCTTRVAHDGLDALRIAEEFRPEVALLDIGLPVMDGYELARRLHELPAARDAKLIAVTGYGQQKDRDRSAEAGFALHLVKPIRMADVRKAIANA
jgi:PAS domain S-box-containing protein